MATVLALMPITALVLMDTLVFRAQICIVDRIVMEMAFVLVQTHVRATAVIQDLSATKQIAGLPTTALEMVIALDQIYAIVRITDLLEVNVMKLSLQLNQLKTMLTMMDTWC